MTDADFLAWLKSPAALRLTLIEVGVQVGGVEITRYLSTTGYSTGAADTPANTHYAPIAKTGIQYTEQLSLNGEGSLSAGDIEIFNPSGVRDGWLNDIWVNRPVRAWIGDPRWPRADFRPIFNGIVADIASKDRTTLALKIRDKLQRLNTPVTENKLGGATPNKDAVLPLAFGEAHNVTPLLVDPATLQYQVHDGAVESIFEVRDNGLPISVTAHNDTGTFELTSSPAGAITVSLQGDKPAGAYGNTVSKLVQRLVLGYGQATSRFTSADLDTASLAAFDAAQPQPVGLPMSDRTNVLSACQMLAVSVGAQIVMSRLGQLRLIQIALPAAGAPTEIRPKHMLADSLAPASRTDVVAAIKLGFCKNWTVQAGLQTAIPAQHKDLFATEWLTSTATSGAVQATYKLNSDPVQQDTMLLRRTDADVEAARQLALWSVPRTIYEFEGTAEMLLLELGKPVTVYNRRYGMAAGVQGMVVSLAPDWHNGHCKVGFLV
ncbi:hypothetical protein AAKU55_003138 [Oxalobacteraceae bacterium GrIS 1.11]